MTDQYESASLRVQKYLNIQTISLLSKDVDLAGVYSLIGDAYCRPNNFFGAFMSYKNVLNIHRKYLRHTVSKI